MSLIQRKNQLTNYIRAFFYRYFYKLNFPFGSSIGRCAYIRNVNGQIKSVGKVHIRDLSQLVAENGSIVFNGTAFLNRNVSINSLDKVIIGDNCRFGEGVKIYDHDHKFPMSSKEGSGEFITSPITIGNNVWFGSNVIILKGVNIGNNVVVGAGAIITRDIDDNKIVIAKQSTNTRDI